MLFPLEALCTGHGGDVAALVGERMRRWVDTVHARCVCLLLGVAKELG